MNWFYVDAGQQAGPATDEQLDELVRGGKVRADTLVWREGLPNWQPYSQARPEGVPAIAPPQPPIVAGPSLGVPPPMYGAPPTEMYYAGFWIRFVAKLIDGLIIGVVFGIPFVIYGFRAAVAGTTGGPPPNWSSLVMAGPIQLASYVIMLLYNGFFIGKFGATPGKMALGLKTVSPEGAPISYGRSFGRAAAEILSGLICNIGYIIAAFDAQKRALHDHIASTRVIRTRL